TRARRCACAWTPLRLRSLPSLYPTVRSSKNPSPWAAVSSPPGLSRRCIVCATSVVPHGLAAAAPPRRRRCHMADWIAPSLASKRLTRRHVLQATLCSAGLAVGQRLFTGFPAVHAAEPVVLHIAGTGVNQYQQIAEKAKEDLGVT